MITDESHLNRITDRIIGAAFRVANALGAAFPEKCYEYALVHERRKSSLNVEQQVRINVWCAGIVVGEFVADLIVEQSVMVELKAIEQLSSTHAAQCINYLAATRLPICLLINFARKVEIKRLAGESLES